MTDKASQPLGPNDETSSRFAETRLHEPAETFSRQEEDIALAAELLGTGSLSERQIRSAVSDWSIHGSVSLADHIVNRGIVSAEQIEILKGQVRKRIERVRRSVAGDTNAPAGESLLITTLERIDGTGRVAKLLGVTVATSAGIDENRVSDTGYQLIRRLGQGGLGRVWLARDLNLNRYVALKEISHPSQATDTIVERFKQEAEITGRLEHPGIVPVYQLGEDGETGRAFYTMRFLGKQTLQDSIAEYHERREEGDEDPMLLRHLLIAFVSICHALGHAHSRKVIHRDLKPENIVIDSFGQVIVIDWGLAKVVDETSVEGRVDSSSSRIAEHTSEGQVLGTPLYMAPEQAAGRLDEVDQRTDIYGLGAILFAIVTGYAPHEQTQKASVDSGVGASGMITAIASGDVPRARDLNTAVDLALEAICAKAMAHRRYARYQEAADLAEDIQRWMAGERVTAYEESRLQRSRRWISRHQGLSQALVALVMIVLVALTTLAMATRQKQLDVQQSRFAAMEGDVREIELQLRGVARQLARDARFIASLPPVQGIVNARAGIAGDSEAVWRGRLESIYTGLLRSNPNYLALSYVAKEHEGSAEIVRVERNPSDPSFVRQLPASRLHSSEADALMASVGLREPGDVKMSLNPRPRHSDVSDRVKRLAVATPVYSDITGECFGMALIEADVSRRVEEVLIGLGGVECEIFVSDGLGEVWASDDPKNGVRVAAPGQIIDGLPAQIASRLVEQGEPFDVKQEYEYIAKRIYVDPTGRGVTIFARLFRKRVRRIRGAINDEVFRSRIRLPRQMIDVRWRPRRLARSPI